MYRKKSLKVNMNLSSGCLVEINFSIDAYRFGLVVNLKLFLFQVLNCAMRFSDHAFKVFHFLSKIFFFGRELVKFFEFLEVLVFQLIICRLIHDFVMFEQLFLFAQFFVKSVLGLFSFDFFVFFQGIRFFLLILIRQVIELFGFGL